MSHGVTNQSKTELQHQLSGEPPSTFVKLLLEVCAQSVNDHEAIPARSTQDKLHDRTHQEHRPRSDKHDTEAGCWSRSFRFAKDSRVDKTWPHLFPPFSCRPEPQYLGTPRCFSLCDLIQVLTAAQKEAIQKCSSLVKAKDFWGKKLHISSDSWTQVDVNTWSSAAVSVWWLWGSMEWE